MEKDITEKKACACGGHHNHHDQHDKCGCPHHATIPIFIILIALVFLLRAFDVVSDRFTEISWPILLGLIGLQKLFGKICKCC